MEAEEPPVYIVTLGRVYRRDTPDATHTPTFHQVECLAVDEGITLADLEGTLDYLLKALFGEERRSKFVTHHFPFTEPSVEALVSCHICDGDGCPVCKQSGWIEVLFKVLGEGLRALAAAKPGHEVSTLGPIGRGFAPDPARPRTVLIGGGVGMPPRACNVSLF